MVAVTHPDPDCERWMAAPPGRQEAVGREVAGVIRCARLDRGGPTRAALPVVERELCGPDRVLLLVGVAGEDVLDEERGLWRDGRLARGLRGLPDDLPVRADDLEDHPRRHTHATVRDRPVCRREVDRPDLDSAERAREAGLEVRVATAGEPDAERFGRLVDLVVADALQCADGRDVEGVLEGLAHEDRTALELVRVARRPALARVELGRHVEQQAARGQPSGIERARVEDRLERGSGLARAVARSVVLGRELLARECVLVIARAARVREHIARLVIERDEGAVVEILPPERSDPAVVRPRDLERLHERVALLPADVRDDRASGQPFLGELLCLRIQGGDAPVAAGLYGLRVTEDGLELPADLPADWAAFIFVGWS